MSSPGKALSHPRSVPNSPKRSPTVLNKRRQQLQEVINKLLMELMLAQPANPLRFIEDYFSHPDESVERQVVTLRALHPLRVANGFVYHKVFQALCEPNVSYMHCAVFIELVDSCLADCDFSLAGMLRSRQPFHGHAISFRTFRLALVECLCYRLLKRTTDSLPPQQDNESLWAALESAVSPRHRAELRDLVLPAASAVDGPLRPHQVSELYRHVILEPHLDALLVEDETF